MGFWKSLGAVFGMGSTDGAPKNVDGTGTAGRSRAATQRAAFAELFLSEAAKLATVRLVEQDPDEPFCIRIWRSDVDEPWLAYLDNIFQETREFSPERRLAQIHRFLRIFTESPDDLSWHDAASGRLLPVVRAAGFAIDAPLKLIERPFLPFVRLFVAIDHADSLSFVSNRQLEDWQKSADEVFERAFDTLVSYVSTSDVEPYDSDGSGSLLHVAVNDDYEPSRLAVPGFLASFAGRVPGNPIAIIPDRSRLLITGDGDPAAVGRLARSAEAEFRAAARPISPAVYTTAADGSVQPLHLASDHPEYFQVERGHRLLAASSYAEQQQRLEKQFERDEIDLFVASLGLVADKVTGETKSWAVMPQGVDSLLPEADLVALGGGKGADKRHAMVPWPLFFEHAPECLELSPEYDPPRWRTVAWPNDATINKLRALAKAAQHEPR